jgi:hypothetical protein
MKKFLSLFVIFVWIISCKSKSNDGQSPADTISSKQEVHENTGTKLSLNNGAKWKVDSITQVHFNELKNIVETAQKNESKDFGDVAAQLQESLNTLVSDCKMTGPDHEALHKWLEPLLDKVKELKGASSAGGPTLMNEISDHMNVFENYFEK